MKKQHHIIYLPGLGDPRPKEQAILFGLWHLYGVRVHYHPLHWSDDRDFGPKQYSTLKLIDQLHDSGHLVSLLGTSAGASAALNAFALRKRSIINVVLICGKIQNIQTISNQTFIQNPSFKQSTALLSKSLESLSAADKSKILSIHPLHDSTVPIGDTIIFGAHEKRIISVGHVLSVALALSLYSPIIVRFIKSYQKAGLVE